ncbi:hypothetical protein O181_076168 [Austropuccinia psidii MF-1]|uniref:Uncharacterized protein n=1 Tax=Austropuccinia psidii MF-1 TaxID=1389203 RepID=A0A9Q3ICJ0_9BASI|nr:hypothetical protein [Austropuccinia psidii MF-1]
MLVMLANKHTRNVCLLSTPSDHAARVVPAQDSLARTPLWSTMMKPYPNVNGHHDPKQADGNDSGQLALSPQVLTCPPPLLGHHPMVTSLLDRRENKTHQIPPNKTLLFLVCLTSKPRGTQWSEELFREPSQTKEPPIPGPSPSSKPPEDIPTCKPEPEVAPMQSTEEPFGIYRITTNFDDYSSHRPQINQQKLVGASQLAPHDSFRGCNSSKRDAPGITGGTKLPPWPCTGGLSKGGHHRDSLQILRKIKI